MVERLTVMLVSNRDLRLEEQGPPELRQVIAAMNRLPTSVIIRLTRSRNRLLPLLAERGIITLGQAIEASKKTPYARLKY